MKRVKSAGSRFWRAAQIKSGSFASWFYNKICYKFFALVGNFVVIRFILKSKNNNNKL